MYEESVFAIYGSKMRNGKQLAAILCKKMVARCIQ